MKRIDTSTATGDNKFQEGNPATATEATVVDASWLNTLQEEIAHVVEQASITLDQTGADTTQLYDAIQALISAGITPSLPTGAVVASAVTTAASGYLLCYGQAVSRTTYATLFSAIGTTFGSGDGSTTFNLPDLRGRVIAGHDSMGGTSANRIDTAALTGGMNGDVFGGTGGEDAHQLTEAELPSYTYEIGTAFVSFTSSGTVYTPVGEWPSGSTENLNIGGSDTEHNNLQPTMVLNYMIKT